ncbi:MAG: hypothetical protein U9R15_00560 [Chloroflexota bacterium]|nr:hypothetical protein [Chloroflexota bacterium]
MEEKEVEELLQAAIECLESLDDDFDGPYVDTIRTFDEAGILSENGGLVIPFEDGSEFHVVIAKSK